MEGTQVATSRLTDGPQWPRPAVFLLLIAAVCTGLNACKPLTIDDTAYYYYASHIAVHPLDPYGFEIFWYDHPQPANEVLAPPVLLYWWALGIRLFGDAPVLWKWWLLPFVTLLVGSLFVLFRRWASGLEWPLTVLVVFSPVFLPSLNLMLDIPALALGLSALAIFLHACDRQSFGGTALAGLTAALAMQTKYTALLCPAAILVHAAVYRQLARGCLAVGLAGIVFCSWEALVAVRYGQSHFLGNLSQAGDPADKLNLGLPLLGIVGGTAPVVGLLGLAALRLPGRWLGAAAAATALGYLAIAFVPSALTNIQVDPATGAGQFTLEHLVQGLLGIQFSAVLVGVVGRLLCGDERQRGASDRDSWFLVLWLGLEVVGYFVLSPFAAVRRVMGVVLVATFLGGRLASRTCKAPLISALALGNAVLALGFWSVDYWDARAQETAVADAARWHAESGHGGAMWYVGHWGFQFYAERAGMKPVAPQQIQLRQGDWLLIPDLVIRQQLDLDTVRLERERSFEICDQLPLRTVPTFYGGRIPLRRCQGPRLTATLYRVSADSVVGAPGAAEPTRLVRTRAPE